MRFSKVGNRESWPSLQARADWRDVDLIASELHCLTGQFFIDHQDCEGSGTDQKVG